MMMRIRTVAVVFFAAMVLTVVSLPALAQGGADVKIEATHVAGNVYMLTGQGGNIGASVGDDGILIVDDQFKQLAEKIRAALRELNQGDLRFILNTHWHGDHTGGNEIFSREGTIIAHTNVRKRLATANTIKGGPVPPSPEAAWPVITFDRSLSIHFNGEEIQVLHLPTGHTDGDSIILFKKSNVLHVSDHFFNGLFPFIDLENGGDVAGYIQNIERIIEKAPAGVKIIPGHGPLSDIDGLKAFHAALVEMTGIVRGKMEAGKSLDEIKAEGLPEKWASWSFPFVTTEFWIETIFKSYSQ